MKHWLASWFQRIGDSLGDPAAQRVFDIGIPKSITTPAELATILDACGPTMARLGYDSGGGVR